MNLKQILRLVTPALLISVAAFAQSGGAAPGHMGSGATGGAISSPGVATGGTSAGTNMGGASGRADVGAGAGVGGFDSADDAEGGDVGGIGTGSVVGPNTRDLDTTASPNTTTTIPDTRGGIDTTDPIVGDGEELGPDRGIDSTQTQPRPYGGTVTTDPGMQMPGTRTVPGNGIGDPQGVDTGIDVTPNTRGDTGTEIDPLDD